MTTRATDVDLKSGDVAGRHSCPPPCSTFSLQQFDALLWKAESKLRRSEKRLIAARNNFREAGRRVGAMREIRKEIADETV